MVKAVPSCKIIASPLILSCHHIEEVGIRIGDSHGEHRAIAASREINIEET